MTKPAFYLMTLSTLYMVCAEPSLADTYRWVDDNGIVNYAERRPRNVPMDQVTMIVDRQSQKTSDGQISPATAEVANSQTRTTAKQSDLNPEQQKMLAGLQQAEQTRQEQVTNIRKDNCERSRRVLNNLSVRSRIRVRAADGTERTLSEDERQERIAEAQRGVAVNCDA